jgi:hypothetical protein
MASTRCREVEREQRGKWAFFSPSTGALRELSDFLDPSLPSAWPEPHRDLGAAIARSFDCHAAAGALRCTCNDVKTETGRTRAGFTTLPHGKIGETWAVIDERENAATIGDPTHGEPVSRTDR